MMAMARYLVFVLSKWSGPKMRVVAGRCKKLKDLKR